MVETQVRTVELVVAKGNIDKDSVDMVTQQFFGCGTRYSELLMPKGFRVHVISHDNKLASGLSRELSYLATHLIMNDASGEIIDQGCFSKNHVENHIECYSSQDNCDTLDVIGLIVDAGVVQFRIRYVQESK